MSDQILDAPARKDLQLQFGNLTVLENAGRNKHGQRLVLCRCACGKERVFLVNNLRNGRATSCCGMGKRGVSRPSPASPDGGSYESAKSRCTDPRNSSWPNYGGRGIKFLFTSFEQFMAELGPRPKGKSLDRINNDGNYEPGNVRWADAEQQSKNRRSYKPRVEKPLPQPPDSLSERETVAWYREQIAIKEAAVFKLEAQANVFEKELAETGIPPFSVGVDQPDKLWARAVNTAKKLRAEIAQLTTDMQKREAAAAEKPVTDTTRDRIARLQGRTK